MTADTPTLAALIAELKSVLPVPHWRAIAEKFIRRAYALDRPVPCASLTALIAEARDRHDIVSLSSEVFQDYARRIYALDRVEWLAMDSAPKDGTLILGYDAKTGVTCVIYWDKHNHVPIYGWIRPVELYGEEVDGFDATHWQPLPALPGDQG